MERIKPVKRVRRTKEVLEQDLFNAAIKVIEKEGFGGLNVSRLMKEAKADAPVFYNRYKDINDFIDKFVRNYDYWLNDSFKIDEKKKSPVENAQNILIGLIESLLDNIVMQKLIAWEMSEDNYITQRTAQNRDNNSTQLIRYFEEQLSACEVNFNVATAILLSGVYYLIIHRKLGTFNQIDFNTKEGIEALKKNIQLMASKIFEDYEGHSLKEDERKGIDIARALIKNKVEYNIIKDATGLSEKTLKKLY